MIGIKSPYNLPLWDVLLKHFSLATVEPLKKTMGMESQWTEGLSSPQTMQTEEIKISEVLLQLCI